MKHSCFIYYIGTSSLTAQERILVGSIRRVIARQAAEIKTLQNKLKELTATSVAAAETAACEISRTSAKFAGVCFALFVVAGRAVARVAFCRSKRDREHCRSREGR
jgi:hypothetical protein